MPIFGDFFVKVSRDTYFGISFMVQFSLIDASTCPKHEDKGQIIGHSVPPHPQ